MDSSYITAYQLAFFLGDVLVAFLLNPVNDDKDKERQEKVMKRLVMIGTTSIYQGALGDALTDAMRPVYWTPKVLVRFSHAGGLPALVEDWAESTCKDGVCKTAIENHPEKAWTHQTLESLLGIMRGLIRKLQMIGNDFAMRSPSTQTVLVD